MWSRPTKAWKRPPERRLLSQRRRFSETSASPLLLLPDPRTAEDRVNQGKQKAGRINPLPEWSRSFSEGCSGQIVRSTIIFLISAIALAGFRLLGQVLVQFMMVWQR